MKKFQINLQTVMFMTELSVLGAYNEASGMLAYNKPLVSLELLAEMIGTIEESGKVVKSLKETDSFGISFYDHNQGRSGIDFHNTKPTTVLKGKITA